MYPTAPIIPPGPTLFTWELHYQDQPGARGKICYTRFETVWEDREMIKFYWLMVQKNKIISVVEKKISGTKKELFLYLWSTVDTII